MEPLAPLDTIKTPAMPTPFLFDNLVGLTFTSITPIEAGIEVINFTTSTGRTFTMYHDQDCCELVRVHDIEGDPSDLLDTPIFTASQESNEVAIDEVHDSHTWTFYRLGTIKGTVVLRWLGESNGYYAESVTFEEVTSSSSTPTTS